MTKILDINEARANGSIGLENALYQDQKKNKYDANGKRVLRHKEVLANILKYSIPEYAEYSCNEIMNFIEGDSISIEEPIAPDTDTRIMGDDTAQTSANEANLTFDVKFRVVKPNEKMIHLHVDVELQAKYHPGYALEKRGIYNLARMISSQLEVVNAKTNYDKLEKAYCIFICVGNVPKYLWNTVSYCEFVNTENIGNVKISREKIDLMGLVIVRIGEAINEEVSDIIHFLHGIFYDVNEVDNYIDFSGNEEFRKELGSMAILGDHLIEYGQHLEQAKTQEAERRAEEAEKRAEEAVRTAENERKKSEELQRELEELKKRL